MLHIFTILQAIERCEYWRLSDSKGKPPGVVGWWPSRAVTFIENQDTGSTEISTYILLVYIFVYVCVKTLIKLIVKRVTGDFLVEKRCTDMLTY